MNRLSPSHTHLQRHITHAFLWLPHSFFHRFVHHNISFSLICFPNLILSIYIMSDLNKSGSFEPLNCTVCWAKGQIFYIGVCVCDVGDHLRDEGQEVRVSSEICLPLTTCSAPALYLRDRPHMFLCTNQLLRVRYSGQSEGVRLYKHTGASK